MSHSMTVSANPLSTGNSLPQSLGTGTSTKKLQAADGSGSTTSGSSSSTSSSTDSLGTTFLSLLVQELQNQDPTAPMDSTQMVGQMISLNQLDQLTSINQTLSNAYGSSATTSGSSTSGSTSGSASGSTPGATSGQAITSAATDAAMRLLASSGTQAQPKISTSVSLPAF